MKSTTINPLERKIGLFKANVKDLSFTTEKNKRIEALDSLKEELAGFKETLNSHKTDLNHYIGLFNSIVELKEEIDTGHKSKALPLITKTKKIIDFNQIAYEVLTELQNNLIIFDKNEEKLNINDLFNLLSHFSNLAFQPQQKFIEIFEDNFNNISWKSIENLYTILGNYARLGLNPTNIIKKLESSLVQIVKNPDNFYNSDLVKIAYYYNLHSLEIPNCIKDALQDINIDDYEVKLPVRTSAYNSQEFLLKEHSTNERLLRPLYSLIKTGAFQFNDQKKNEKTESYLAEAIKFIESSGKETVTTSKLQDIVYKSLGGDNSSWEIEFFIPETKNRVDLYRKKNNERTIVQVDGAPHYVKIGTDKGAITENLQTKFNTKFLEMFDYTVVRLSYVDMSFFITKNNQLVTDKASLEKLDKILKAKIETTSKEAAIRIAKKQAELRAKKLASITPLPTIKVEEESSSSLDNSSVEQSDEEIDQLDDLSSLIDDLNSETEATEVDNSVGTEEEDLLEDLTKSIDNLNIETEATEVDNSVETEELDNLSNSIDELNTETETNEVTNNNAVSQQNNAAVNIYKNIKDNNTKFFASSLSDIHRMMYLLTSYPNSLQNNHQILYHNIQVLSLTILPSCNKYELLNVLDNFARFNILPAYDVRESYVKRFWELARTEPLPQIAFVINIIDAHIQMHNNISYQMNMLNNSGQYVQESYGQTQTTANSMERSNSSAQQREIARRSNNNDKSPNFK